MTAESHDSYRSAAAVEDAGMRLVFAAKVIDWRPLSPTPHPTPPRLGRPPAPPAPFNSLGDKACARAGVQSKRACLSRSSLAVAHGNPPPQQQQHNSSSSSRTAHNLLGRKFIRSISWNADTRRNLVCTFPGLKSREAPPSAHTNTLGHSHLLECRLLLKAHAHTHCVCID